MAQILPITPTLLSTYKTCPKQYAAKYITKDIKYVPNAAGVFGDSVHKSIDGAVTQNKPLNDDAKSLPAVVDCVPMIKRVASDSRYIVKVEQKMAINREFQPVSWWDKSAWIRVVADVFIQDLLLKRNIVIDWKTGKVKDDVLQADLSALCATAVSGFHVTDCLWAFVKHDAAMPLRRDMNDPLCIARSMADVRAYEQACRDDNFPAMPNGLCMKWCGVESCPYNGKNR